MRYRITIVSLIVMVITIGLQVALVSANRAQGDLEGQQIVGSPDKGAYQPRRSRVFLPLVLANIPSEAPTPVPLTDTPTAVPPRDTPVPPTDTPIPTPTETPMPPTDKMVGIQAAGADAWPTILGWGGRYISVPGYEPKSELLALLDQAQAQGMKVIDRWPGRGGFSSDGRLDLARARDIAEGLYGDGQVTSHPAYGGSYMIDEPGNPQIWNLAPGDLDAFYEMIKSVDPNIMVVINFGWLEAARNLSAANACDVAGFTYTGVRPPGHWESQAAIGVELKRANPDLIVSPWVAVWAYPAQNYPIPTAAWVREQGMKAVSFDVFDGVFFFPWQHYPFTGETIVDVADDSEYISAFNDVFDAAMEKLGNQ